MRLKTVFETLIVGAMVLFFTSYSWAAELLSLKDYLKSELSTSAKMGKETFPLTAEQKKELQAIAPDASDESITFYYGRSDSGVMEKACTVLPQKGKEGPLSVGVCYDSAGLVQSVKILSHEEERGKGIESSSFLKQFNGKKVSDAYIVGKDVDGITGATWSSKAMAEVLRKAGYGYKTFVQSKK